jgi:diacylglycerol O-acyltransferase / wax synthase
VALSNAPEVNAGEPTRFIGLHERIAFGAYFLWPGSFGPWIWTIVLWHAEPGGDIDRSSLKNDRKVRVMTAGNIAIDEDHPILMERLSAQDLMNLWPDEFGWPMDLGALAILDGTQLIDTDGRFKIETAREAIARRLHLVPRFRQQLYTPRRGLGGPLWVDAQHFDLAAQIGVFPVPPPAGEAQLLLAVERLRARQLDRSRPLWEIWFLPGLPQHRVGVFIRMHHTVADGMAGVALLGTLLDQQANPLTEPVPSWTPAPLPSTRELLQDAMRSRLRAAERLLRALGHPLDTTRRVQRAWPSARVGITDSRAPQTSLNRRIGVHRTITIIRCRLDLAKQIAHAHEAKVNDVLLAAVAGGLRQLLGGRGEPVDGVVLRAFVPVSLHHEQGGQARGNQDATMIASLPIGEPDPVRRLRLIATSTAERKKRTRSPGINAFPNGVVQRMAWRMAAHQHFMNLSVTNVPGPPRALFLAGAELLEVFPVIPISVNLTLGVGALSYNGQFNITAVADRDACPDVNIFATGVQETLRALAKSTATVNSAAVIPGYMTARSSV